MFTTKGLKQNQNTKQRFVDSNPIESVKGFGAATAKTTKDEMQASMKSFWEQLLGTGEYKQKPSQHEAMQEGEEYVLSQKFQHEQRQMERIRPAYDYVGEILKTGERVSKQREKEIEEQVKIILAELKRLAASSMVLEQAVVTATGQAIVKPGDYHLTFFQWLLVEIRQARIQIENAGAWLATMQSKRAKRGYWNMAKKHGTTFLLSGERTVSTQTS